MTTEAVHDPDTAEPDVMDAYRAKLKEVVARSWPETATAAGWPPSEEVPV